MQIRFRAKESTNMCYLVFCLLLPIIMNLMFCTNIDNYSFWLVLFFGLDRFWIGLDRFWIGSGSVWIGSGSVLDRSGSVLDRSGSVWIGSGSVLDRLESPWIAPVSFM